ncbi:Hypothetical predicted protein [Mytilus galloprovincialis]|uniref:Mic1 domain-containing protein n=1 Tax=Mytilus galloprovincialis TaxID=29158 RepID=A0A8B6HN13_MYTGA|nr:Hypothetical predicted protein [Mytilus galloprovincialis]
MYMLQLTVALDMQRSSYSLMFLRTCISPVTVALDMLKVSLYSLMLSLEHVYAPAHQLALDMLKVSLYSLMLSLEHVYTPAHQLALDMLKVSLYSLMLSLEHVYAPAHQLALDMLKRVSTANEEIIEVLLSKHQLLPAVRFIRSVGIVDTVSARKFLEAAMNTDDSMLFYTVFKFFEQRNIRLRQNPRFPAGEHCEEYVKHFEGLFDHNIESYLEDSDEEERFSMDQGRQEEGDNLVWDFQNVSQHSGPVPIPSSVMGRFFTNFSKDLETGDTPTLKDLRDFGLYHHECSISA